MNFNKIKKIIKEGLLTGLCISLTMSTIFPTLVYARTTEKLDISIDTSNFIYDEKTGCYDIKEKVDNISGNLIGSTENINSFSYNVKDDKGIIIKEGNVSENETWDISDIGFALGRNLLTITIDDGDSKVTKAINVYNETTLNSENIDVDNEDYDNDGLINYWEEYFGTDQYNSDTDNDGVSDSDEILKLGTDPLKADSSSNNTNDGDDDFDNDGITNKEELKLGTDPYLSDSDDDKISDADEINIYGTNPAEADSDNDGADDGWEINNGYDPLTHNDVFTVNTSSEDKKAKINSENLTGSNAENLKIEASDEAYLKYAPGAKSKVYEVNYNGVFTGKLSIDYTKESEAENPEIYQYDMNSGDFTRLETNFNDGRITADISANSENGSKSDLYIVVDSNEYDAQVNEFIYNSSLNKSENEDINDNSESNDFANSQDESDKDKSEDKKNYAAQNEELINNKIDKTSDEIVEEEDTTDSNNDGISDADTLKMCNGEILTNIGAKVFDVTSYDEIQSNDDFDDDGIKNGDEITIVKNDDDTSYVLLKSSPVSSDSDNDGISDKEDSEPLKRGLKDGIIGAVQLYARHGADEAFFLGHSFLVFTSYVNNETITIDNINRTYDYDEGMGTYVLRDGNADTYTVNRGNYVSIGNYRSSGLDVVYDSVMGDYEAFWTDSGLSEYLDKDNLTINDLIEFGTSGNSSALVGDTIEGFSDTTIRFNEEIYDTYAYEDFTQYPNAVLTRELTQEQLDEILEFAENHNYYNLFSNNCTSVAAGAWNTAFLDNLASREESGIYSLFDMPMILKSNILKRDNSEQDVETFGVTV